MRGSAPSPISASFNRPLDVHSFFEALGRSRDEALRMLRARAPVGEALSPRVQELLSSTDDWSAADRIPLVLVSRPDMACLGRVGTGSSVRFCCEARATCAVRGHTTSRQNIERGWYIAGGTRVSSGAFADMSLPMASDDGPVTQEAAVELRHPESPFMLSVGQWRYIFAEWAEFVRDASVHLGQDDVDPIPVQAEVLDLGMGEQRVSSGPEEASIKSEESDERRAEARDLRRFVEEIQAPLLARVATLETQGRRFVERLSGAESVNADVFGLMDRVRALEIEASGAGGSAAVSALDQRVRRLSFRVAAMAASANQPTPSAPAPASSDMIARVSSLSSAIDALRDDLNAQPSRADVDTIVKDVLTGEYDVANMVNRIDVLDRTVQADGGINMHGIQFRSPDELPAWLGPNLSIGLFVDAVSILHAISPITSSHETLLKSLKAQHDVRFTTDLEARVVTSFKTNLLALLYGSVSEDAYGAKSLEKSLKTYEDFWSPHSGQGKADRIEKGIREVQSRVATVSRRATTNDEILRLVHALCADSVDFVFKMIRFITDFRTEMVATSLPDKEVWSIAIACIEEIINDLWEARAAVQDAAEIDPYMYLWGTLKCHEVMQRFVRHNFHNNPAIIGVIVRKVIKRSGAIPERDNRDAKKAVLDVKVLDKSVKDLLKRLEKLEQKL